MDIRCLEYVGCTFGLSVRPDGGVRASCISYYDLGAFGVTENFCISNLLLLNRSYHLRYPLLIRERPNLFRVQPTNVSASAEQLDLAQRCAVSFNQRTKDDRTLTPIAN